jgi:hypothetical protein
MNKTIILFKLLLNLSLITLLVASCNNKSIDKKVDTDEPQIFKIVIDKIYSRISNDTNTEMVLFCDSLMNYKKERGDPWWHNYYLRIENFQREFKDTSCFSAFVYLIDSSKSKLFDTSVIKHEYHYRILKYHEGPPRWRIYPREYMIYRFSPVAFNQEHTTACIYQTYHCGMDCSGSEFLFFRKINGKWGYVGSGFSSIS